MPIEGRSAGEVGRFFRDHLNQVLHATVTRVPLSLELAKGQRVLNLRFRASGGSAGTARLRTRYGELRLSIGQLCEAVVDDSGIHRLRTLSYRYALLPVSPGEALLRWEYLRTIQADAQYCRHHLQGPIRLDLYDRQSHDQATLQRWHLPTGWIPIEDVLRFCIVDLGVKPLSDAWEPILAESAQRFRREFSTPGQE